MVSDKQWWVVLVVYVGVGEKCCVFGCLGMDMKLVLYRALYRLKMKEIRCSSEGVWISVNMFLMSYCSFVIVRLCWLQ